MAKYLIRYGMGYINSNIDYSEVEIPDDEDPETNPEMQEMLAEAYAAAVNDISVWYEPSE